MIEGIGGLLSGTVQGLLDVFSFNVWLGLGVLAVIIIGCLWLASVGVGWASTWLKIVALVCFIIFIVVLIGILYQEFDVGQNLTGNFMNITQNVTNPSSGDTLFI